MINNEIDFVSGRQYPYPIISSDDADMRHAAHMLFRAAPPLASATPVSSLMAHQIRQHAGKSRSEHESVVVAREHHTVPQGIEQRQQATKDVGQTPPAMLPTIAHCTNVKVAHAIER